jgi:hypothetical protein
MIPAFGLPPVSTFEEALALTHAEQQLRALRGTGPTHSPWRRSRAVASLALFGGAFALLIWMKLRVVGGVPRTAYADPNETPQAQSAPGSEDSR